MVRQAAAVSIRKKHFLVVVLFRHIKYVSFCEIIAVLNSFKWRFKYLYVYPWLHQLNGRILSWNNLAALIRLLGIRAIQVVENHSFEIVGWRNHLAKIASSIDRRHLPLLLVWQWIRDLIRFELNVVHRWLLFVKMLQIVVDKWIDSKLLLAFSIVFDIVIVHQYAAHRQTCIFIALHPLRPKGGHLRLKLSKLLLLMHFFHHLDRAGFNHIVLVADLLVEQPHVLR